MVFSSDFNSISLIEENDVENVKMFERMWKFENKDELKS